MQITENDRSDIRSIIERQLIAFQNDDAEHYHAQKRVYAH